MASSWAASALDWWEEAGVDTIVGETPRDWLESRGEGRARAGASRAPAPLPDTLDALPRLAGDERATCRSPRPSAPRAAPAGDPASGPDDPGRHAVGRRRPAVGRGRRPVRQDAGRDRARPRDDLSRPALADPHADRRDRRGQRRPARRDRPAPYRPRRAQGAARCSATFAARLWSARRSPARAPNGTKCDRGSRLW